MNDFLPSRKVTAFVLVPVITIFSLWSITNYYSNPVVAEEKQDSLQIALEEGEREFQEQDTDGDGLKDWEEFLYQTDERNPDTDGDGASDGLEVKRGFDPLVPGNGDVEEIEGVEGSAITFYKNDPTLTRTDLLARDIFVAYRELKEGQALDATEIRDRAIEKSLLDNTKIEDIYKYAREDIQVVSGTKANQLNYRRSYNKSVETLSDIQFNEVDLFSRYNESKDEAALAELTKNRLAYEEFGTALAQMSVPEEISIVHLELVNNIFIFSNSIKEMASVEEDPLGAFLFAQKSIEDEQLVFKNLDAITLYFERNNL